MPAKTKIPHCYNQIEFYRFVFLTHLRTSLFIVQSLHLDDAKFAFIFSAVIPHFVKRVFRKGWDIPLRALLISTGFLLRTCFSDGATVRKGVLYVKDILTQPVVAGWDMIPVARRE